MVIDDALVREVTGLLGREVSKGEILMVVLGYCGLTKEEAEEKIVEAMREKWS